jgi:hypothetical protein
MIEKTGSWPTWSVVAGLWMTREHERLIEFKERVARQLMSLPRVTGAGIGGRERDGRPTGEIVIKVLVARKRSATKPLSRRLRRRPAPPSAVHILIWQWTRETVTVGLLIVAVHAASA